VISILIPPNLDLMNIETIIQSIPASSIADIYIIIIIMRVPTYDNVMIEMIIYAQIKVINMKIMINPGILGIKLAPNKS
jgi:hypothetical protein